MDNPSPAPSPAEPKPKRSAKEVLQDYGIPVVPLLVWVIWCIRDGWFNPGYEHIGFSRINAIICTPILIFCSIMAGSAARTLWREKKQSPPPSA